MVVRKFVTAVAVSTALVLGTAGCSLTHDVQTMQQYSPSDGTNVTVDGVKGLNLIYLTKRTTAVTDREVGGLIGSFVNTTKQPVVLHLQFTEDGSEATDVISVQKREWVSDPIAPGAKFDLGYNENPALSAILLSDAGLTSRPGDLITVWLAVNNGSGVEVRIPALDGTLEQYQALVDNLGAGDEHSAE